MKEYELLDSSHKFACDIYGNVIYSFSILLSVCNIYNLFTNKKNI